MHFLILSVDAKPFYIALNGCAEIETILDVAWLDELNHIVQLFECNKRFAGLYFSC